ncbi:MAG: radical SAM family heme chaperone HemW [Clostridia bacterium]|nr:radical SAM family heme chaperone HemW [Clostridia bacterium]
MDSKHIQNLLKILKEEIQTNLNEEIEITLEVNPGTANKEKLLSYKEAGVNRLSIGLQSTNNKLLKEIGRIHTYEQFLETYNLAKEVGFENINVDLMLALPNQSIQDLKQSVEDVIKLNSNHISVYSLILEEGTPFYELDQEGKLNLPSEEQERQMYWYVKNKLELAGYNHYEISNFSKFGKESKHNLNCWNQEEYLGFGLAAHSYFDNKRFSNISNLDLYMKNIEENSQEKNVEIHEDQSLEDKKKEYILLGLRKIEGVSISKFKEKFVDNPIYLFKNQLSKLVEEELLEIDGDYIKLTNKGLDLANLVWEEFI